MPKAHKNTPPKYQYLLKDKIPVVNFANDGGYARIIAGEFEGVKGAASVFSGMNVFDIVINANSEAKFSVPSSHSLSMVVLRGKASFNGEYVAKAGQLVGFEFEGGEVSVKAGDEEVKILLLSGEPIDEPIVDYGSFVMNTTEEIRQAIKDFNSGKFGRIS